MDALNTMLKDFVWLWKLELNGHYVYRAVPWRMDLKYLPGPNYYSHGIG